jgi:hypothetical protein
MTWVWYRGRFQRAGSDLGLRLTKAQELLDSGDQKRAVRELWFAEAIARGDADALPGVLALAAAFEAAAKARRKSELAELVQVLHEDILETAIGQAAASATRAETVAAPRVDSGWWVLAAVVGGALLGALIGGVIGGATYEPCTDPDCWDFGRSFDVYVLAMIGLLIGALAGPILWLLWRARRRSHMR